MSKKTKEATASAEEKQADATTEKTPDFQPGAAPARKGGGGQKPTVGRDLHYYFEGDEAPHAAKVTRVNSGGTVNLAVFNDEQERLYWRSSVEITDEPKAGCAVWPPRV